MVDALFVINPMGLIKTINKATANLLGYTDNELIGEHINSLFEKGDFLFNDFKNISKDKHFKSYDLVIKTKDGKSIPVSFLLSLMQSEEQKSLNIIGIARDMREKMELEAQLIQSEKLSALGELTAGIAHELNQPLNGIKIVCQSINRDIEKNRFNEEDLGKDLQTIISQIDKMSKIITHMRIFTRKSDTMMMQPVNVNDVINDALLFLEQLLLDHGIKLTKTFAPVLPMIVGDPIRLEQIFVNLITNALNALNKVMDKREKMIEIRSMKDSNHLICEIEDNGVGIPDDIKEKIFQPFFTTMEPGKGTGLGLSVSSKIITEHKGILEMKSTFGKGSLFRLKFMIQN